VIKGKYKDIKKPFYSQKDKTAFLPFRDYKDGKEV
jgi:hypothetical protein